ncbi:hypothetical protein FXB40_28365 [Bradyrhizobium rifense]|uniref:Uncharacterized protein n=1 Tax=Bradyrhizobium rifense TaxID=515499 RepID=A0A5D3KEJ8_9BRAD|nr:hypothetical protein [Bradyrhizobium rifense]TYL91484.1 hypothetical protein FXB40_28365 [Bradyrhizobium rifense]
MILLAAACTMALSFELGMNARFFDQLDIILEEKKFPKPIVVVPVKSGLSVIDGNNRIAAHAYALSPLLPADHLEKALKTHY